MPLTRDQKTSLDKIFKRLDDVLKDAIKPKELTPLAEYAIDLIVKRTRLGYGVSRQFGSKTALKKLSKDYIDSRKKSKSLFELARPSFSNLTRTGQMLSSMAIVNSRNGKVTIGPTGNRSEGKASNAKVAGYQKSKGKASNAKVAGYQESQGRIFNRVSSLEYQQVLRFYRRSFGDLLRRKRLLQ